MTILKFGEFTLDTISKPINQMGENQVMIYKGTNFNDEIVIFKTLRINGTKEETVSKFRQEFKIMNKLNHKNIVKSYNLFHSRHGGIEYLYNVMEYCPGGDLLQYIREIGEIPEKECIRFFKQIVSAVVHIHENNIAHRDIKLDNILLDKEGNVKLIDFGLAAMDCRNETLKQRCGTLSFVAPEVARGIGYNGMTADIWSLGVVLYALLSGRVFVETLEELLDVDDSYQDIIDLKLRRMLCTGLVSGPLYRLLSKMLYVEPAKRIDITQVAKHEWLGGAPEIIARRLSN